MRARAQGFCALAGMLALAGCSSIGPATIKRDRSDYSSAMANSWKELQLLNIVKYRYFDPPVFLEVPSVVSQQELYARAQATSELFHHQLTNVSGTQDFYNLEAQGRYIDRPTISYMPITGQPLVDLLLRPVPPATIFAIIDAGYPADFIMDRSVKSMNDLYNYSLIPNRGGRPEDPRFRKLVEAIARLQRAGAIAARTTSGGGNSSATTLARPSTTTGPAEGKPLVTTLYFRRHVSAAAERDIRLVKSLLGLDPRRDEFTVTDGPRHTPQEIAVTSRSLQEVLEEFASGVDVPAQDVDSGRATRVPAIAENPASPPLIHIHSGPVRPDDDYSAVYYQHHWFWIDNDDLRSKLDFLFLMVFASLTESRSIPQIPMVTISAGGGG
jgi:hypothetical protein